MRFGLMRTGRAANYLKPRPLLLKCNARNLGYQQWRWLNFFVCVPYNR